MTITEGLEQSALDELSFQFAPQIVLWTALKVGVFAAIADGAKTVSRIASVTDCSIRGIGMLLNSLATMGLLDKKNGTFELNPASRKYFLPSGEDYIGLLSAGWEPLLKLWLKLPAAVKTGRPSLIFTGDEEREKLNSQIADALFQAHRINAWKLANRFDLSAGSAERDDGGTKVLDVAAGSAVWSIPFALKSKGVKVAAIDFSSVLQVAKRYARRFGVEDQYDFVRGDIRRVSFGTDAYDLVLLGHICHSEGADSSRKLFKKSFRALRRSGKLLIMDYIPDEERKVEIMPLLLALNALLATEEGDTFTFSEYREWLLQAGFAEVRMIAVDSHCPVIIGLKN